MDVIRFLKISHDLFSLSEDIFLNTFLFLIGIHLVIAVLDCFSI